MKTSVTKMMMSFALMGCLIIGASDASAQGRSRSQGGSTASRSQSAAVSRSSNTAAPQVSRATSAPRSSSATPQVSRPSEHMTTRATTASPQVNRSNPSTATRPNGSVTRSSGTRTGNTSTRPNDTVTRSSGSRTGNIATSRPGNTTVSNGSDNKGRTGSTITTRSASGSHVTSRDASTVTRSTAPTATMNSRGDKKGGNGRPSGSNGNDRPGGDNKGHKGGNGNDGRGNFDNDRHGNNGHGHGNNGRPGGDGHHGDDHGKFGGNHGYDHHHRYDYNGHHYRDQFSWNYAHHSWSRACPPPTRVHRPAPMVWYRPVIPAGWHPYAGAPVIDRILGLVFGTLYEASLDHLYYNGYFIDGYADGIIYLRDVPMLNLYWPDVMLNYDYNRLVNAQFIYHSNFYDTSRYDRVYRSLSRIYGPPVYRDGMTISWYGGNSTGYVTLTMNNSYSDYYTTMSIGY